MRLLFGLILFGIQVGSVPGAMEAVQLKWWIVTPLEKVKPQDPAPAQLVHRASLFAGRNEFEPFQLVLRAEGGDVLGLDVECSDLRSEDGDEISKSNVMVYAEQFLNITRPSLASGEPGLWPDALIPRTDRYANERRNAFPFNLHRGTNQPLWIDVFVPRAARPGNYTGTLRVTQSGKGELSVAIHLKVWAFMLPSTSTLKSSFGLNGTAILKQHLGRYTSDADLYGLTHLYAQAALMHRVSIHGGSQVPPKHTFIGGKLQMEWGSYDAEVAPLLNGTSIPSSWPLHDARETTVELRTPGAFESEQERSLYLKAWMKHFEQKGWGDRLFFYLWDEPPAADLGKVLERGQIDLQSAPDIRTLVTTPFNPILAPAVKIWVPLVNCLERKPGGEDFCADAPGLNEYRNQGEEGKSFWFYQSCASHGCNTPGGEYFKGWPSYMVDASGPANRVMQWIAWKYRIEGELYYNMTEAYVRNDPWSDLRLFGGNGDGTLFYPGEPQRIGGHSDIPIESIRLKLIREGMEDYEYLALLAKLKGRHAANSFADRIVSNTYLWERRADAFLHVRQQLGEALDQLTAHLANGNDTL